MEELTAQLTELKAKEDRMPEIVESFQQQLHIAKTQLDAKKKGIVIHSSLLQSVYSKPLLIFIIISRYWTERKIN